MCGSDTMSPPSCAADALALLDAALDYLNQADAPGLAAAGQAGALIALERAEAKHTAARAKILAAFDTGGGYAADGHYGARPWLRAFTKVTKGAAAGAAAWARRLAAHPAIAQALAAGEVSVSWAREISGWTDQLPADARDAGDAILLAAATGGADLHDLALLAREMIERSRTAPDPDEDGFADRGLHLDVTMTGVGALRGDLTAGCAAALSAVLDALAGKAGPEDTRSFAQRRHDALEEACHRLIAAQMVPGRDGQPVHLLAHIDLAALRAMPGADVLEADWAASQPAATRALPGGSPGPGGTPDDAAASPGDATRTTRSEPGGRSQTLGADQAPGGPASRAARGGGPASATPGATASGADRAATCGGGPGSGTRPTGNTSGPGQVSPGGGWTPGRAAAGYGAWYLSGPEAEAMACDATIIPVVTGQIDPAALARLAAHYLPGSSSLPAPGAPATSPDHAAPLSPAQRQRLQHALLALGADLVSGPGGLAAYLRTRLLGHPFTGTSQPLDLGTPTAEIPPHLRKAVILRDRHCGFPGCQQPPAHCQIHHLIPRSQGGKTALGNLKLLCRFHHLIVIHRWGWTISCHPDGTTTATAPDGRTLHSHGPPSQAA